MVSDILSAKILKLNYYRKIRYWIDLAQNTERKEGTFENCNETSSSMKCREFID
jgi:hypothetical protein